MITPQDVRREYNDREGHDGDEYEVQPKEAGAFALPDALYRMMYEQGMFPAAVICPECYRLSTFRNDTLAARFECTGCGHAVAAMYGDPALKEMLGNEYLPELLIP